MAVHLTKIYTRTGDDGTTGLSNFDRVPKDDSRLVAYADCDEANCAIGQVLALGNPGSEMKNTLMRVQNELFDAGADLATPIEENPKYPPLRIDQSYIDRLEHDCDHYNTNLEPLNSFILPGGTPAAALLHTARTIVRRAERAGGHALGVRAAGHLRAGQEHHALRRHHPRRREQGHAVLGRRARPRRRP